jgi:hydroxymethylbilane synthase
VLRIATRRSALARAQAFQTGRLFQRRTGREFTLIPLASSGDLSPDRPVGSFDVKGMFVDTIRAAVQQGEADVAIHSYKDLPTESVPGLTLAAVPEREDPRDVLISRDGHAFSTLPPMATVGTSSERRKLQLLRVKPGLQVLPLRGNLDTRLRKVAAGEFDAVVIAMAGLRRLYVPPEAGGVGALDLPLTAAPLEPGEMLPAAGQGALAVECRTDDQDVREACRAVDHVPTHRMVRAERAFLSALGGGCLAAVGALCSVTAEGGLELAGMVGDPARRRLVRQTRRGSYGDPEALGAALADELLTALG